MVDHPHLVQTFTTDCVSCHTTTRRFLEPPEPLAASERGSLAAFGIPNPRFLTPNGITGFMADDVVPGSNYNVRNFGYFMGQPTVSSRSVNEAADVANFTNQIIRAQTDDGAAQVNPGLFCEFNGDQSLRTAFLDFVWDCSLRESLTGCLNAAKSASGDPIASVACNQSDFTSQTLAGVLE